MVPFGGAAIVDVRSHTAFVYPLLSRTAFHCIAVDDAIHASF